MARVTGTATICTREAIAVLEVRGSYFGPARTGHLLKSRAKTTSVLYNRLTGEGGTSSYEIDIPNGGDFKAIGNLVQQGNQTENYALISYGAEGYRWPTNRAQIVFNTLVNDRAQGGVFITMRAGPAEAVDLEQPSCRARRNGDQSTGNGCRQRAGSTR